MTAWKFSVITTTWNRKKLLADVYNALSGQSFKNFEWIVANDGSTDGTLQYVKSLLNNTPLRIKILSSSVRVGKAVMDNAALDHATGEYVVWCDSDDIMLPHALEKLAAVLESSEEKIRRNGVLAFTDASVESNKKISFDLGETNRTISFFELYTQRLVLGDMLLCVNKNLLVEKRFPEVDFVYPEGGLWSSFKFERFALVTDILKRNRYNSKNAISFSRKMEYNRGRAYSLASTYQNLGYYSNGYFDRLKICSLFWRYSLHGELSLSEIRLIWTDPKSSNLFFLAFLLGLLFSFKDRIQGKVLRTHREFQIAHANTKISVIKQTPESV